MIPIKTNPDIVWKSDTVRIVVWYDPFIINADNKIFKRMYVIEHVLLKDALGEPNWHKIHVESDVSTIIEGFLDELNIAKDKILK
ncbi:hypothetical protein LCGC14_1761220 [marine sediment metagenome]|uniref:Uncharacterized protein n=1 Tax=marine sediment metagenome TaxID=412755 RepID=A0A0F9H0Z6_9ZZZZ